MQWLRTRTLRSARIEAVREALRGYTAYRRRRSSQQQRSPQAQFSSSSDRRMHSTAGSEVYSGRNTRPGQPAHAAARCPAPRAGIPRPCRVCTSLAGRAHRIRSRRADFSDCLMVLIAFLHGTRRSWHGNTRPFPPDEGLGLSVCARQRDSHHLRVCGCVLPTHGGFSRRREHGGQRAEDRGQRAEGRGQRTEGRGQRAGGRQVQQVGAGAQMTRRGRERRRRADLAAQPLRSTM